MTKFFLLKTSEDIEFKEVKTSILREQIAKIKSSNLKIGLDVHAGFNIPSYIELKELLLNENGRKVEVFFSLIDSRAQSADLPYSPNKIFVKKENTFFRKKIFQHKSAYVSQIPLEKKFIMDSYKEILGTSYKKFQKVIDISIKDSKTLGEFMFKLNCLVLREVLKNFKNILLETRFDIFNENNSKFHPITTHNNQQIVYIALHKAMYDKKELEYLKNKFKKTFSKDEKYILLPINPNSYFLI